MFNSIKRAFPLLLISVFFFIPVSAQQVLKEIIVTADYRQSSLDDIAASITVINADTMAKKNAQHLEDILLNAPNVNFSSGASRARFIQIRGIGNVAMLYDVKQVEILMGPQGTRYGSNALAGLINLKSKAPSQEFSSGLQFQTGNNNSQGLAGFISGPATDDLFYRLSMQKIESDGFSQNLFLNKPTNQRDETTLRAKFHWQITDTEQLDFTTSLIDLNNGYDIFSLDNVRDTLSDEPGFDRQNSKLASLKFTSSSSDTFTLELLGGFAQSDIAYGYDEDWVNTGFHPFEYSSTDHYFRDRKTGSAELRLISGDTGAFFSGRTDWVAGLYSLHQDVDLQRIYTF
ncbi:MAG: TonB-dependent receptor plug domain-containing protein, partial [Pseudomonadales bacterium]